MSNIKNQIKGIRAAIIAIGFRPADNQINILGSGFAISDDGKILSSAHLYNQLKEEQIKTLMGMAMVKQEPNGLEQYQWLPLSLIKKNDQDDLVLFQIENSGSTLLKKLELADSDSVQVGDDTYFVGFPYAAQLVNDGFGITLIANKTMISNIKVDGVDTSHPRNWFIVDAISNPGNSGCPLVDVESNKVIGVMAIAFRMKSMVQQNLDIREPMHIAGAKPINLAKKLL